MTTKDLFKVLLSGACAMLLLACSDTPDNVAPEDIKKYAVFVTAGNANSEEAYYTLTVDDLNEETVISPVGSGIVADADLYWATIYSAYSNGNFYYTMEGNSVSKRRLEAGKYKEIGNVVGESSAYDLFMMKTLFNTNGLNFISWQTTYNADEEVLENKLFVVDTTGAMTVKSKNPIKFPMPTFDIYDEEGKLIPNEELSLTPSSFAVRNNKLFIGYHYHWLTEVDTAYMLVCDYPSLGNVKILKDTRLGHVSGSWYAASSSFTDDNGDYYFTTVNNDSQYGVLRIKSGATEIDPTYEYDLKELGNLGAAAGDYAGTDHHTYLKNGLAFISSYVIDVRNKKVVKDLNSFGLGTVQKTLETYTENSGNDLYVILKTDDSRWFIAKYDVDKGTLTKGAEIDSGITAVTRISRLK